MNHFFTEPGSVAGDKAFIQGSDVNHIINVLRMGVGDRLLLSDGTGVDYLCEINSYSSSEIICNVLTTEASRSESPVKFYLFQGLPKADKLETIIQKSVELGVFEIIPTETSRCVVKYEPKKLKSKLERWQKIAESAAKQSHRGIIPEVKPVMSFKEALKYAADLDMILIPYENFKDMSSTREAIGKIKTGMKVGIFIGPEGGFEEKEVTSAREAGAAEISLGQRILRTETAPLAVLSILMFMAEE